MSRAGAELADKVPRVRVQLNDSESILAFSAKRSPDMRAPHAP